MRDSRVIARAGWHQVVTPSVTSRNEVVLSEIDEADVERVIDEVIATYRAIGRATKWCVGPWTKPADMGERLARRGFRAWPVRGMGRTTSPPISSPPGASVVPVSERDLDTYLATSMRGWSQDPSELVPERDAHLDALAASPRVAHMFLASLDAIPLGTGALALRDGYAYLLGTQVLPESRHRGLYRALVSSRLSFLHARGIPYAVTHARDSTSAPILSHLGFETLFHSTCWVLDP